MESVKVKRVCVISEVRIEGQPGRFWALELPWRDNEADISCIPPGTYRAVRHFSPNLNIWVWWLKDVPGRSYVYLHIGNKPSDTLGCILPGNSLGVLGGEPAVLNSGTCMDRLLHLEGDEIEVKIE